ncbi:hypothetical protein Gotur_018953 [Gossypium turneri]
MSYACIEVGEDERMEEWHIPKAGRLSLNSNSMGIIINKGGRRFEYAKTHYPLIYRLGWAKHFISIHNEALETSTQQYFHRPDSGMCVYLNIDVVVNSVSGFSATSGVIHYRKGNWILGYNRFLRKCSVAVVELWGLLDGLLLL